MKNFVTYLFLIGLLMIVAPSFSQTAKVDSLRKKTSLTKNDTVKVKLLHILFKETKNYNPDTAQWFCKQALDICERIKWKKGIANAENDMGVAKLNNGDYPQAMNSLRRSLNIYLELNDRADAAICYGNMGLVYADLGDFSKALSYYLKALKMDEELGYEQGISRHLGNIGTLYSTQLNDNAKALSYLFRAIKIAKHQNDRSRIALLSGNIGMSYIGKGQLDSAFYYHTVAFQLSDSLNDEAGVGRHLGNLGHTWLLMKNYVKAEELLQKSLSIRRKLGAALPVADVLLKLSEVYMDTKKYGKAESVLKEAADEAGSEFALDMMVDIEKSLFEAYKADKKFMEALKHSKLEMVYSDSLFSESRSKKTMREEMNFEFEKKETIARLDHEKKEMLAQAEGNKQKIYIYSICAALLLVVVFAFFVYRNVREKQKINADIQKQKEILEEKQKEILDSIRYARRIQMVRLASEKYIDKNLRRLSA